MSETDLTVTVSKFDNAELFRHAKDLCLDEKASQLFWLNLKEEKRVVLLVLVREVLTRLLEDPAGWVPLALEPDGDDWLDIKVRIQMPSLSEGELKLAMENMRLQKEAFDDIRQIEKELR